MGLSKLDALWSWVDTRHGLEPKSAETFGKNSGTAAYIKGLKRAEIIGFSVLFHLPSDKVNSDSVELVELFLRTIHGPPVLNAAVKLELLVSD